jgi:putative transposase
MRYTTFRFALDPTPVQEELLARHAGASRFAYNECLRFVTDALTAKGLDPSVKVPWSGYDLINAFNTWKKSEDAGRVFVVSTDGTVTKQVTGLAWRHKVSAQVFEEAAVDLGHALSAYSSAKRGTRAGRQVGFPGRKRKGRCRDSFRLRNKQQGGGYTLRVGEGHPRSVTLPKIGRIRVHDDTRSIRCLLRPNSQIDSAPSARRAAPRAKILFATIARRGTRWYVSLNVQAPDLHPGRRHQSGYEREGGGFVGVDRGLLAFAVAAGSDGTEVGRWPANNPLTRRLGRLRRRSRALSRAQGGSRNHARAARRLAREHAHIADARRTFLHEVSSQLVKNHARLAVEDLAVDNLVRHNHLARAIGDAGWSELARQLVYKAGWFRTNLVVCDRWYASSRICSRCGIVRERMELAERVFHCDACELVIDRDRNAAANLAARAEHAWAPDRQAGGRVTNASGGEGAGRCLDDGETGPEEGGTRTPAIGGVEDIREGWRQSTIRRLPDALEPMPLP